MVKKSRMTRRRTFFLSLGAAVSLGTLAMASRTKQLRNQAQPIKEKERDFSVVGEASLRQRAAEKGLIYGASVRYKSLFEDSKYAERFAQECGILVPGYELTWQPLRPSPDRFDFSKGDRMANFARSHNMLLSGVHLVWHKSLPKWFEEKVNHKNAEQVLVNHINTVAGHYAGKMYSWNVVNEAIKVVDKRADGLRKSPWLKFLGSDYIETAFHAAAEADSKALLIYNENDLEFSTVKNELKRAKVLSLLERLKSKGVPLYALGMQSHIGLNIKDFNPQKLRDFLKDVASLGLKIMITEMDISEKKPLDIATRDRLIASVYEDVLSVMLDEPAVVTVITWGLSDRYTWLSSRTQREDGKPVRPLPLDAQMERKLAWNAIARAFEKAPMRKVEHQGNKALI